MRTQKSKWTSPSGFSRLCREYIDFSALDSNWSSVDPGELAKPLASGRRLRWSLTSPVFLPKFHSKMNQSNDLVAQTGNSTNKLSSADARTGHVQILIWFTCATTEMEKSVMKKLSTFHPEILVDSAPQLAKPPASESEETALVPHRILPKFLSKMHSTCKLVYFR